MGIRDNQPLYSDKDLLSFLWNDDPRGLEILFRLYHQPLFRFVFFMLREKADAEDTVQEVYLNLWKVRHHLEGNTRFKAYLFRACKNKALSRMKAAERLSYHQEELIEASDETCQADEILHHQHLSQYLEQQINSLPPKRRLIFQLSRFEQMTYKEIADYLDISQKTVEHQIMAALKFMRQALTRFNS